MDHQGLRWNVHCVANVALRIPLNLYKRGFKIYDLLLFSSFCLRLDADRHSAVLKIGVNHATCYVFGQKLLRHLYADNVMDMYIVFLRSIHFYSR